MSERMRWKGEKRVYQPRISRAKIKDVWRISQETEKPMTKILDEALEMYIINFFNEIMELHINDEGEDIEFYEREVIDQ